MDLTSRDLLLGFVSANAALILQWLFSERNLKIEWTKYRESWVNDIEGKYTVYINNPNKHVVSIFAISISTNMRRNSCTFRNAVKFVCANTGEELKETTFIEPFHVFPLEVVTNIVDAHFSPYEDIDSITFESNSPGNMWRRMWTRVFKSHRRYKSANPFCGS